MRRTFLWYKNQPSMKATPTVLIVLTFLFNQVIAQNVGIGTNNPTATFSVHENFKVDGPTGKLTFTQPNGGITFGTPSTWANSPMITLFSGGTDNKNRMIIGHSSTYPNWGIQYQDSSDNIAFMGDGKEIFTVGLNTQRIIYRDGFEEAGKILTSDANGEATWQKPVITSAWITSPTNSRDTTVDGTCMRVRTLPAPEITQEVLDKGLVTIYMKVGSIGPYQLPYINEAGGALNQVNAIFRPGYILVYRHTYNTCRFNSGIAESYPGQPVLINLPQSLEYRYVIRKG